MQAQVNSQIANVLHLYYKPFVQSYTKQLKIIQEYYGQNSHVILVLYHQQMSNRAYFEQTWLCRPSSIICRRRSDKKEIVHNIIHCRIVIDSPRVKVLGECNLKKKGLLLLQKPYYTTSVCTANAVFLQIFDCRQLPSG